MSVCYAPDHFLVDLVYLLLTLLAVLFDSTGTHTPNFEIVMELLKVSPELLFIVDHRGATPLTYVPREAWGTWCDFLQENRHFLREMVKSLRFDRARYYVKNMVPCLKF